ncbi:zinc finger and BTB domain-containing protein 6 [Ambystoma mexicanum]|uniref:zinc finger and BTB domain-containing protein 6 n=1 Tax=Ambystoma mexicanum TaxID=8296 RepID=UPI0037E91EE0
MKATEGLPLRKRSFSVSRQHRVFKMASDSDILHFKFEQQGDGVLHKMNLLREQNLFCDVSICINDAEFHGHKVVFAACSTFMRDQFLLNKSKQMRISILQSAEIGRKLLLSCYTGVLEVRRKELLKYLTAASYLQMVHIVEKCTEALSRYFDNEQPMLDSSQNTEKCDSSDNELENRAKGLDKDCEIIEISEDGPLDAELDMKPGNEHSLHSAVLSPSSEKSEVKNSEISTVEVDYKNNEICVFRMGSLANDADAAERDQFSQPCTSSSSTLYYPETQHSLINSTVESRLPEMATNNFQDFAAENPDGNSNTSLFPSLQCLEEGASPWRHQCPKCPRGFLHIENYLRHLKMHKLFLCLECGKTFTQKKNLNRHIRGHMGIRPFQCVVCMKTFTAKSTLQDHMNIHSGDRPYKCSCCDMDFKHKSALKKHLNSVHARGTAEKPSSLDAITKITIDYD